MIFTQEEDSCQAGIQQIDVAVEDAGGGKFFRIKTDGWAFDKIDELVAILEEVKTAFRINQQV